MRNLSVIVIGFASAVAGAVLATCVQMFRGRRKNAEPQLVFGIPDEWQYFRKTHSMFLDRFFHLKAALDEAFLRTGKTTEPIDRFVFFYGRLCCEDFFEVLLCCGNGYGAAALKLVRSLYERAITLRYLHDHPEFLPDFMDFHHVSQHKLLVAIKQTFGEDAIPEEMATRLEQKFDEVKGRFMVTGCTECGAKRLNHTWNRLDFVAMAKETGSVGRLIVPGYYMPMKHAHATLSSILLRLEEVDGGVSFVPTSQHPYADQALTTAHNIILEVLRVQEEHFKSPGLKEKIEICKQDFLDIHRK